MILQWYSKNDDDISDYQQRIAQTETDDACLALEKIFLFIFRLNDKVFSAFQEHDIKS